jgi:hypothetical protein
MVATLSLEFARWLLGPLPLSDSWTIWILSRFGYDPQGDFPLFYKKLSRVLAPKVSFLFRKLIRKGSFPHSWRVSRVTPIPKGAVSPDVAKYRPISLTPIICKVFEKLVAHKLSKVLEHSGLLPPGQFAYRKGLGCCDALLSVSHFLQSALDQGMEARLVQLNFSAAFDRVIHQGLLYKLESCGVGGSMLSIIRNFLCERSQCVAPQDANNPG